MKPYQIDEKYWLRSDPHCFKISSKDPKRPGIWDNHTYHDTIPEALKSWVKRSVRESDQSAVKALAHARKIQTKALERLGFDQDEK